MVKVSVIIPVYNVEEYLRQALDSVINQTFDDIEIICVNDGSTDNSLKILEEYAGLDNRILIINQTNKGVSVARNVGINQATGEYIIFVDPDDWIEDNLVEEAYKKIYKENLDIVSFGHICYAGDGSYKSHSFNILEKLKNEKFFTVDIIVRGLVHCVWDKIYKREFIINNQILFPKNIKNAEDVCFCLLCVLCNAKWGGLNKCFYNYRIVRKNSAMSFTENLLKNEMSALYALLDFDIYQKSDEKFKILCLDKFMAGFLYRYNQPYNIKIKFRHIKQIQNFVKDIKNIVPYELLQKIEHYKKIKKITFFRLFIKQVFNFKNEKNGNVKWKVLTLLGIKFRFNKKILNI